MILDKETFQVVFWIVSVLLVLCGMIVTTIGWRVTGNKARALAEKKDVHDSIDKTLKALMELEDCAYSFWLDNASDIKPYRIITLHRRLVSSLTQLGELRDAALPSTDIASLRRQSTLDAETISRPVPGSDERIRRISRSVTNIMNSDLLKKSWSE